MSPTDLDYLRTVAAKARLEAATNPEHGDAEFLEVLDAAVEAGEYQLNGWTTMDRLFAAVLAWVRAIEAEKEQPDPVRLVTFVDAAGRRVVHGGHHDDEEAVRMAIAYWQCAVEEGEIGIECLEAVDAGQYKVTRSSLDRA